MLAREEKGNEKAHNFLLRQLSSILVFQVNEDLQDISAITHPAFTPALGNDFGEDLHHLLAGGIALRAPSDIHTAAGGETRSREQAVSFFFSTSTRTVYLDVDLVLLRGRRPVRLQPAAH